MPDSVLRHPCIVSRRFGIPLAQVRMQPNKPANGRANDCGNHRTIYAKELIMLQWALLFLLIALVAAVFGFGGIAASFATIGKILFFVFLVLFLVSLISGAVRRPL
jgi:uncharacterized membrane protein YtjA (UPF0391 family)